MISNHKNKGGLKMAANLLSSVTISEPPAEAGNGRGPPSEPHDKTHPNSQSAPF
jgi:hypothetical protein